jgi:hypothetical protein
MDCAHGGSFAVDENETDRTCSPLPRLSAETELEFLARRAMEESRLARRAASPQATAAHSYLAAAYAAAVGRELARQAELQCLILSID